MTLRALVEKTRKAVYSMGTVRHWAKGDVQKTAKGWEPVPSEKTPMSKAAKAAKKKGVTVIGTAPTSGSPKPISINISLPPGITLDPLKPGTKKPGAKPGKEVLAVPSSKKSDEFLKVAKATYTALKALGTSKETSPKEAQAAVRDGLATLLKDYGIWPAPMYHLPPGEKNKSDRYLVMGEKPYDEKGLRGSYSRSGKLRIAKGVHEKAMSFLKGGPPYDKKPLDDANSFRTLVHEQIHGTGVLPPETYKGLGVAWEEAMTEMSARKVMVDSFGVDSKDMHDVASYSGFIRSLRKGVQGARLKNGLPDLDYPSFFAYLGEAALATRRNKEKVLTLDEYKERFARNLTVPEGFDDKNPTASDDYRRDAVEAIDNWFKQNLG